MLTLQDDTEKTQWDPIAIAPGWHGKTQWDPIAIAPGWHGKKDAPGWQKKRAIKWQ